MTAAHWYQGMAIGLQQQLNNSVQGYEAELDELSNDVEKLQRQVRNLQIDNEILSRVNEQKADWLEKKGHLNVGRARYRLQAFARDLVAEQLGKRYHLDHEKVASFSPDLKRELNLRILAQAEFYMSQEYCIRDMVEYPFHVADTPDIQVKRVVRKSDMKVLPLSKPFRDIMTMYQEIVMPDLKNDSSVEKAFVGKRIREWKKFGLYPEGNAFPAVKLTQSDTKGEPFLVLSQAEREYLRIGQKTRFNKNFTIDDISHPLKEDCHKNGQSPLIPGVTFITM